MTTLELRLYEELKGLRRRFREYAADHDTSVATPNADMLIRECEAQIKRDAEEVRD